jgi:hypothetical protein
MHRMPSSQTAAKSSMGSGDWLIVGLDRDFDGDILIDGQPVDGPGLERGMVFQDHGCSPAHGDPGRRPAPWPVLP